MDFVKNLSVKDNFSTTYDYS